MSRHVYSTVDSVGAPDEGGNSFDSYREAVGVRHRVQHVAESINGLDGSSRLVALGSTISATMELLGSRIQRKAKYRVGCSFAGNSKLSLGSRCKQAEATTRSE